MTKFTGPLIVGDWQSDTTAATIDVSGTAVLRGLEVSGGGVNFSGVVALNSGATVSGTATFQVSPRSQQGGKAVFVAQATLVAANTGAARLSIGVPSGANIINYVVDVEEPFTTGAGATAAVVQGSVKGVANATLAQVTVSASGRYDLVGAGGAGGYVGIANALRNVTATIESWVSIQGSNTALANGQAMLSIHYVV